MTACPHPDFAAVVDVNRLEDVGAFTADVRIRCTACAARFQFIGPPIGSLANGPSVSLDGCELRIPIRPEGDPRIGIPRPGYTIRVVGRSDA